MPQLNHPNEYLIGGGAARGETPPVYVSPRFLNMQGWNRAFSLEKPARNEYVNRGIDIVPGFGNSSFLQIQGGSLFMGPATHRSRLFPITQTDFIHGDLLGKWPFWRPLNEKSWQIINWLIELDSSALQKTPVAWYMTHHGFIGIVWPISFRKEANSGLLIIYVASVSSLMIILGYKKPNQDSFETSSSFWMK